MLTASDVADASPGGGLEPVNALGSPTCVPSLVHSAVESSAVGPQMKNVTFPVGVGGAPALFTPWTTARSVTLVPGVTWVCSVTPALGVVVSDALQLAIWNGAGPTRSFIWAVPELPELRLTAKARPKLSQAPGVKTCAAVRSIPASPNSLSWSVSLTGPISSSAGEPTLTLASAKPPAVRLVATPQQGGFLLPTSQEPEVTQRRRVRTGVPPPPSKS